MRMSIRITFVPPVLLLGEADLWRSKARFQRDDHAAQPKPAWIEGRQEVMIPVFTRLRTR
jgi:hypothetical protein